jgi:hypothetical protein
VVKSESIVGRPGFGRAMKRRRTPEAIAAELDAQERVVLFCVASRTNFPITNPVRSRLIIRGLIERTGSRFIVTDLGRAVLATLLAKGD